MSFSAYLFIYLFILILPYRNFAFSLQAFEELSRQVLSARSKEMPTK